MQARAFSATIRPSAGDSIILGVSRGMWTVRPGAGKGMCVYMCERKRERRGTKERKGMDVREEREDGCSIG